MQIYGEVHNYRRVGREREETEIERKARSDQTVERMVELLDGLDDTMAKRILG